MSGWSEDNLPTGWDWREVACVEAGSELAASILHTAWEEKPSLLLGAATGNSPTGAYGGFVQAIGEGARNPDVLRVIKLDEWGGLPMEDPATCEIYLQNHLIGPLKLTDDRFASFRSDAESPENECRRIDKWLEREGPIDLCVLGLGLNGHLGFNEPAEALTGDSHVAALAGTSLEHSMLELTERRPSYGLTLGMGAILASKTILLLIFGQAKALPVQRMLSGGIRPGFPASFLTRHRQVICVIDEDAARSACGRDLGL
ncbi:MAG: 6-phosphogluconolactonase [Verrucomicrobiota bacterium]